jgi:hypothetical protein
VDGPPQHRCGEDDPNTGKILASLFPILWSF